MNAPFVVRYPIQWENAAEWYGEEFKQLEKPKGALRYRCTHPTTYGDIVSTRKMLCRVSMANPKSMPRHQTLRLTKFLNHDRPLRFGLGRLFLWFTLIAIFFGALAWLTRWPYLKISGVDISDRRTYTIESQPNRFIDGLSLKVSGDIDGQATITLLGDYNQAHSIGPGKFDTNISPHEFYENKASIHFAPQNVTKGHVILRYKFHSY